MPAGVDEKLWKRAEAEVLPHADRYREPYAVTRFVYNKMYAAKMRGEHLCATCAHGMYGRRRRRR